MKRSVLESELERLRTDIIESMIREDKRATGRTAQQITYDAEDTDVGIVGRLYVPSYFPTLQRGRPPARSGSGSDKQAFIDNLRQWIVAKGLQYKDEKDLQRLANFLRWRINKLGNKDYQQRKERDIYDTNVENFAQRIMSMETADLVATVSKWL